MDGERPPVISISSARLRTAFENENTSEPSFSNIELVNIGPKLDNVFHLSGTQGAPLRETETLVEEKGDSPFDFKSTLDKDKKQRDAMGLGGRELPVAFSGLTVTGEASGARYQPTIGSILNPVNLAKKVLELRRPTPAKPILHQFEGAVKSGEMLLVLGRPGSGCSTFLKTLANHREAYTRIDGEVVYGDGIDSKELQRRFRGDVGYSAEDDVHLPTLTVGQTLEVSTTSRTPARKARLANVTRKQFQERTIDILVNVFGLKGAVNTVVGDENLRGVSGGEKKRVSIAEMMSTRVKLGCWDNSTRGLDASTALEFARALRTATDMVNLTTVVSIYQVPDRITNVFDKICLIYEGHMIYFGPAHRARDYFVEMGFEQKHRQTTADFLVGITNPYERTARAGWETRVPRTPQEFVRYFRRHPIGQANAAEALEMIESGKRNRNGREQYKLNAVAEKARGVPMSSAYTISIPAQIREIMRRRFLLIKNDPSQIIQIVNFLFSATLTGSVYLKLKQTTDAYFSRGGVLFFSVLFGTMQNSAEIPSMYAQRPVVARHMKSGMFYPFIDALAITVVDAPITLITQILFSVVVYWMAGLQKHAANFFIFILFITFINLTTKAFFRALAASFRQKATAMGISGIFLLVFVLYTGYLIPLPSMIGALRWLTWINPLHYGYEALISNEFHNLEGLCTSLVPTGPGYEDITLTNQACTLVGSQSGRATVNGDKYIALAFNFSYGHMNFGILVAFWLAFVAWFSYATERAGMVPESTSQHLYKQGAKIPEHDEESEPSPGDAEQGGRIEEVLRDYMQRRQSTASEQIGSSRVFSWQHLNYDVFPGGDKKRLLNDISGYVVPGKLTALMGETGAGKTTLLNVLAQRVSTGVITGDLLVDGSPLPRDFARQTGYCQQMDIHLDTSTVREALMFSALLRQPASVSVEEKRAYVEEVIKMCEMEDYADAIVGSGSQGLSVERRKRLTIGVELAAKPQLLLFLDEPTSGLDSQSAWQIVTFLKTLADRGQAILCTIHQPSSELFQQFDRVLLLQKGGRTVYFGDLGHNAETLIDYFERNGGRHCEVDENPAEYILDVIGAGATAKAAIDWHATWKRSGERDAVDAELQRLAARRHDVAGPANEQVAEYAASFSTQFSALYTRSIQNYMRNPSYILSKFILNISAGLFIGFTFFKAKDSQQGLQNKLFGVFIPSTLMSLSLSNQLQVPFINFRTIWEAREKASKMYHWIPLTTTSIAVELPFNIISATFFFFCWYWTVGFPNDSDRVGYQWLMISFLFPLYFATFAQWTAAMASNPQGAALAFTGFFAFGITFNGVMQPFSHLITFWHWTYFLSPFTHLIDGLFSNGVGGQRIVCAATELTTIVPPDGQTCGDYLGRFIAASGGYLVDVNATTGCEYCSMSSADTYLTSLNMSFSNRWRNAGFMFCYISFNIFLTYLLTYLFQVRKGLPLPSFKRSKKSA
ncbi:hypothetical protein PLICRDRAFT_179945 [Plicaturopsis crispa FD-325 SS-3]|uniref:ABC transporter domain-containing protein n=1 Tax=Plicaturopsis crispa FD-325 SS-3 TaxID=944288 RepID=A0A0C9SWT1_PLICR|nr:hypothetical protein PLICRDRAFT_179945 [Plicaturopsis crispa FD-325 SS-3]